MEATAKVHWAEERQVVAALADGAEAGPRAKENEDAAEAPSAVARAVVATAVAWVVPARV